MKQTILIIEDDIVIRRLVAKNLRKWDYDVVEVEDFQTVLEQVENIHPHLIVMDIGLPFFNGYYWCQEIRSISTVPILFLSSHNQPMDIVMAINLGGDDYVSKPFDMMVLLAKIQGLLRRTYDFQGEQTVLTFASIQLDLKSMQVSYGEMTEELTKNEFQILRILFERQPAIVSRQELMKELWNSDLFIDDNTLTVNVGRLRRKLAGMGLKEVITTKKGIGYGLGMYDES